MTDAPTPLDLDAITALGDDVDNLIDEVKRLRLALEVARADRDNAVRDWRALIARTAPAWDEDAVTDEALSRARAALAQASPSQMTPWIARLVDEVVDSTLAVVRDHLPVKPHRDALAAAIRLRHREMGSSVETVTVDDYEAADAALPFLTAAPTGDRRP